jgi:polyisoprenoid-binding protein YceI
MTRDPVLISLALALTASPVLAAEWRMLENSEFTFEATFEGSAAPGRFAQFDLSLEFDPENPEAARLEVTVSLAGADMGDPDMNTVIADPVWFDVVNFPQAVFASERIEQTGLGEFVASGILNLKGISQAVAVPFSWSDDGTRGDMRGQFALQRIEFNVGSGEWAAGDAIGIEVQLQFDIQLERAE